MEKMFYDLPAARARSKVEFLIESFKALGADRETPDFRDWGLFSDGVIVVLEELAEDLDEIEEDTCRPVAVGGEG